MIYLIGSLRNPRVPDIANILRGSGYEVFDDWYAAGPEADDKWREYEQGRGHNYARALDGYAANHVYSYDRTHLDRAAAGVLVLPAGRSGHLELGYLIGQGKPGFILLETAEPERWDVMYRFAQVCFDLPDLIGKLKHANLRGEQLPESGADAGSEEGIEGPWTYRGVELAGRERRSKLRAQASEWAALRNPGLGRDSNG